MRSGTGKVFLDFSKRSQARKKVIASSVESAHRRPEVVELVSGHVLVVVPPAVTPHAVFTGSAQIGMESPVATTDPAAHTFSQVLFVDIPQSYPPATPVTCRYTLTPALQPQPRDWVGIFKVKGPRFTAPGGADYLQTPS